MKREFIEQLYFHELGNRDRLDSRIPALVAILSVLGGMLYFSIHEFTPIAPWLTYTFLGLIGGCVALYLAAIGMIYRGTFGHEYERLPTASVMRAHHTALRKYYESKPTEGCGAEEEFDDFLMRHMLGATDRNTLANLTRGARYYKAMVLLAACVILALVASGTVLGVQKIAQPPESNHREDVMSNEQKPSESVSPTASGQPTSPASPAQPESIQPATQPVAPAATKPAEPDNIVFKGNQEPSANRVILHDDQGKRKEPK
jgi:hypothetical protein